MNKTYEYLLKDLKLKYNDTVIVALSGGPDSMALASLLLKLRKALDINVVCAHVNHNTGRAGQEKEQKYVEKFCAYNNLILETFVIEQYGDDNFHNEAHSKRYEYFDSLVKKYKAKYLLTAHHGDDLMETILMRIVRGSTLRGYSGFSKTIKKDKYYIVRPLINVTKKEILSYLKLNKVKYMEDESNNLDVYTRNRFRKYIVPNLKKEDENVHNKFYKFSKTLLEYNEYIEKQVKKEINLVYKDNVIDIDKFLKLDKVIGMKIIYTMLEDTYQDTLMLITDNHAELLYNLISSKKANLSIYLPNNIVAKKAYKKLTLVKNEIKDNEYEIEFFEYANIPNGKNIQLVKKSTSDTNNICRIDKTLVTMPLHIRSRKNGDKMSVKGMLGSKKINDIFIDNKIPMDLRDTWPIVVDSKGEIVWLPGLKKSKFCKSIDEKYDIILRYY